MTVTVPLLPTPLPTRLDQATFADRADATLAALNTTLTALNTQNTENNLLNQQVQSNADAVGSTTALVLAMANYKGVWSTLTGSVSIPATVEHSGRIWMLLQDLANITTQTPAGGSAYWRDITPISTIGGVMQGDLQVPSLNGAQIGGKRNKLLNGRFAVNQGAAGEFQTVRPADNWKVCWNTGLDPIVTLETFDAERNFLKIVRSGLAAATGATQYCVIETAIEGRDTLGMIAANHCLSFLAYNTRAGTYCVALTNSTGSLYRLFEYTISASVLTKVVIPMTSLLLTNAQVSALDATSPAFDYTSKDRQLKLTWSLAAGSSLKSATVNSWAKTTGSIPIASTGQTDAFFNSGTSAELYIGDVQLEPGLIATPCEWETYVETLVRCRRYYRTLGALIGYTTSTTAFNAMAFNCDPPMRDTPQVLLLSGTNALHDPGISFPNITSVGIAADPSGGYLSGVCSTTTASKLHSLQPGKVALAALLL